MLYPALGVFAAGLASWCVVLGLQLGGLAGAAGTLAPALIAIVCAVTFAVLATELMLSWTQTTRYTVGLPHLLAFSAHALMTLSSAALYAWVGERYPGSFTTASGAPTALVDYYVYAVDITSTSGYGFTLPDALALKILFIVELYAVYSLFFVMLLPALVAVIIHALKQRRKARCGPRAPKYARV